MLGTLRRFCEIDDVVVLVAVVGILLFWLFGLAFFVAAVVVFVIFVVNMIVVFDGRKTYVIVLRQMTLGPGQRSNIQIEAYEVFSLDAAILFPQARTNKQERNVENLLESKQGTN